MRVHVLLYDSGKESEGIHSLEIAGSTVVLMFEAFDDAARYSGLLEAQDFPIPSVEEIDRNEIEAFCYEAGYEARFVEEGFVPKSEEERLFLAPPQSNLDVSNWEDPSFIKDDGSSKSESNQNDIDEMRKRLEGLI